MSEEKKSGLLSLLENWKAAITIVLAIVVTAIAIRTAFWEYSDKAYEREQMLRERQRDEDNRQQVAMFREVFRNDLDSMMRDYNAKLDRVIDQSIRKDSILLIVLPGISRRTNQTLQRIDKIDAKVNLIIRGKEQTKEVNFIEELNRRDSIAAEKARRDSIDMVLLREIRKVNRTLAGEPKWGDRSR